MLPGLGLLLCLHGRLHLVLCEERLTCLDRPALPLPEIGGYPLHVLSVIWLISCLLYV